MHLRKILTFEEWQKKEKVRVGVVILFHKDKILTLHRGPTAPWMPNKWDLPGGTAESGEDVKTTAVRECQEETKIVPQSVQLLQDLDAGSFQLVVFTAESPTNTVEISWEHQNFRWIGKEELNQVDFVPFVREAINMAFSQRKQYA
jgi:8-oxo-dGTP pyrophosphatase MutT (NUDIX family)